MKRKTGSKEINKTPKIIKLKDYKQQEEHSRTHTRTHSQKHTRLTLFSYNSLISMRKLVFFLHKNKMLNEE